MEKQFLSIQDAMKQNSGPVNIRGWVYRERKSKKLAFIIIRDSTNIIQCVLEKSNFNEEEWEKIDKTQIETSMEIYGDIKKDDRAPSGYEIQVSGFNIVGFSDKFPIQKDQSQEFLLDNRHLWLRSRKMTAILKIRSTVFRAVREFFTKKGFHEFHSPIFQATQCEGGSSLFEVNYFDKKVYLAQTWQLYAEPAIFALEKIFTIAPSFRAEKSVTSRHLTEYWHAEMEIAWGTFNDLQNYAEEMIKSVFSTVLEENKSELELLQRDITKLLPVIEKPFERMTYTRALEILKEKNNMDVEWGKDLRTVEEEELTSNYDVPIIVTHYPKKVKAFYMKACDENPDVVLGFDLLGSEGYGEIIGASQRETDIDSIKKRLTDDGESPSDYEFYLDTRKWGSVPHGGFGLGVERLITWICGLENIKDSIPFPRTPLRVLP